MDNRRHDSTPFREARTLQRPSFQSSSYHSGRAMVCHLQAELSRRVRSDGGARRNGRTYHRFAMGPTLRPRLREKVEELRAPCRFILESRRNLCQSEEAMELSLPRGRQARSDSRFLAE